MAAAAIPLAVAAAVAYGSNRMVAAAALAVVAEVGRWDSAELRIHTTGTTEVAVEEVAAARQSNKMSSTAEAAAAAMVAYTELAAAHSSGKTGMM